MKVHLAGIDTTTMGLAFGRKRQTASGIPTPPTDPAALTASVDAGLNIGIVAGWERRLPTTAELDPLDPFAAALARRLAGRLWALRT